MWQDFLNSYFKTLYEKHIIHNSSDTCYRLAAWLFLYGCNRIDPCAPGTCNYLFTAGLDTKSLINHRFIYGQAAGNLTCSFYFQTGEYDSREKEEKHHYRISSTGTHWLYVLSV